jgi:protein-S-isoprenylcysteine O-methyltransferase Ste14
MKTIFVALRAAAVSTGFILLWGWIARSLHLRYDPALGFTLPEWTRALGIAFLVAGGALALACVTTFVARGEGTPAPFDPPRKFVAAGPYKFERNPMYIGGYIALFGYLRLGASLAAPAVTHPDRVEGPLAQDRHVLSARRIFATWDATSRTCWGQLECC